MTKRNLLKRLLLHAPSRAPARPHLRFLDGLLEFFLQAADATRQGLRGTGRYLHRQLEILANHVARLAAVGLKEVHGCEAGM